jgi:hypothetical protein
MLILFMIDPDNRVLIKDYIHHYDRIEKRLTQHNFGLGYIIGLWVFPGLTGHARTKTLNLGFFSSVLFRV